MDITQLAGALEKIFGQAASSEFLRTLAIFTAAAFVHGKQVRQEIEKQLAPLTDALLLDAKLQRERIDKIEKYLRMVQDA